MADEQNEQVEEKKTTRRKSAPKPEPVVHDQALGDAFLAAISELRQQLRVDEALVLPGIILRALPEEPGTGDRAKVMDWRAWVVWAEWTGSEWDVIVYQDGKPKA